jgi:hypothetical protein
LQYVLFADPVAVTLRFNGELSDLVADVVGVSARSQVGTGIE